MCSTEKKSSRTKRDKGKKRRNRGGKLKRTRRDALRALTRDRIRVTSLSRCFRARPLIESLRSDSFDLPFDCLELSPHGELSSRLVVAYIARSYSSPVSLSPVQSGAR